jgi:hypothetical protein
MATSYTEEKQTSIPLVGFEPTIPGFERAKTIHGLDRVATVFGILVNTARYKKLCS